MRARADTPGTPGRGSGLARGKREQYVDELMDAYVSWREACAAVAASYENWRGAERQAEELAFSAYVEALDREERAARAYQAAVAQLAGA
jgi:hypothetical protein